MDNDTEPQVKRGYHGDDDLTESNEDFLARRREHKASLPTRANATVFPGGKLLSRPSALDALTQLGEVLYAVQLSDETIKIGHSGGLRGRLAHFGDFEVLAFKFGTYDDEQAVHRQLAAHVNHGREWYNPTPEVMAVINGWRAELGREPIAA